MMSPEALRALARWADLPRWARGLIVAGGAAVVGLWVVGHQTRRRDRASGEEELKASRPKRTPGQRYVVVAGQSKAGKSAVANALLGTDLFGPQAKATETAQYRGAYYLRELPAGALHVRGPEQIREHLSAGDILILVVEEQLYRAEREFLDLVGSHLPEVRRLVFINKKDLLLGQYTLDEAEQIRYAVGGSAEPYVDWPDKDILWGSAAAAGGPDIDALRDRLDAFMDEAG